MCPSSQLTSLNLSIVYSFRDLLPVQLISKVSTEVRFIMLIDYLVPFFFLRFASLMNVSYYVRGLMKQISLYYL